MTCCAAFVPRRPNFLWIDSTCLLIAPYQGWHRFVGRPWKNKGHVSSVCCLLCRALFRSLCQTVGCLLFVWALCDSSIWCRYHVIHWLGDVLGVCLGLHVSSIQEVPFRWIFIQSVLIITTCSVEESEIYYYYSILSIIMHWQNPDVVYTWLVSYYCDVGFLWKGQANGS